MRTRSSIIAEARDGLDSLFKALQKQGYKLIGPALRDQVILYDELHSIDDLPAGWTDEQDGGTYRVKKRHDNAWFGYNLGPRSFKQFLHVPQQPVWRVEKIDGKLEFVPVKTEPPKYAFIGIRSCEIHAIQIQDRVLMKDAHSDPHYSARREDNFIVAVNCAQSASTCFCTSMNTGPGAESGFDLALTELISADRHVLLIEAGTERGEDIIKALPGEPAGASDKEQAAELVQNTADTMQRKLDSTNVREVLLNNLEHPRWDEVAERCLSCGNCTQVCPTCFCTNTVDTSSLDGDSASRSREWDSCFNVDFSYLHGGSIRQSTKSRYRQWLTHKLATWHDQFDSSGCVGCGRCITWCPVGIDITEEVRAISQSEEPS
ncbi:MAG: 4Fe-4S dicluster domain-containing protein [Gammaproteobacteria bacterium]